MTLEERLIAGNILDGHNALLLHLDYLIHQLHGVTVGQYLTDAVDIHEGFLVGVIVWSLHFMLAYLLAHHACKLIVDGMTRLGGDDTALDGLAYERHVTDDVEQLVTCRLVVPNQWLVLQIAQFGCLMTLCTSELTQLVEVFLCGLALVDDNCVVKVTSLDESIPSRWRPP